MWLALLLGEEIGNGATYKNNNNVTDIDNFPPIAESEQFDIKLADVERLSGGGDVWLIFLATYSGDSTNTRSAQRTKVTVLLRQTDFNCSLSSEEDKNSTNDSDSLLVLLTASTIQRVTVQLKLEGAPLAYPQAVDTIVDSGAVGAGVLTISSGIVRVGVTQTLLGMLRCTDFDATEEVGYTNNMFGWGIGREELRYQRGSVVSAMLLVSGVLVIIATIAAALLVCTSKGYHGVMDIIRIPSSLLPLVLFAAEMGTSSATTLLIAPDHDAGDVVLGAVFLMSLGIYTALYIWRTIQHPQYCSSINTPTSHATKAKSAIQRALRYLLRPTHDSANLIKADPVDIQWLSANYYFVEDRRVPLFGGVEALVGLITNVIEGIPLISTNTTVCVVRPAIILVLLGGLVVFAILRVPNAVRLQQGGTVGITGALCLVAGLVIANVIAPSDGVELAAGYVAACIALVVMVVGAVELLCSLVRLYPPLREYFSFTMPLSLKLKKLRDNRNADIVIPQQLPPPPPVPIAVQGPHAESDKDESSSDVSLEVLDAPLLLQSSESSDDDAFINRILMKVDQHHSTTTTS